MAERGVRANGGGRGSRRGAGGWWLVARLFPTAIVMIGCDASSPPTRLALVEHLVALPATTHEGEPGAPEQARLLPPLLTPVNARRFERVGNEARPVLRGYPIARPARGMGHPMDANPEILTASFPLPAEFQAYTRALVTSGGLAEGKWTITPPRRVPIARVDGEQRVDARFPLARFPATATDHKERAWLRVQVRALAAGGFRRIQTAPLLLPDDAQLLLGLGILHEASAQGTVAFSLSACVDGDCTRLLEQTLDPKHPDSGRWNDHVVSLASLAGREVAFRFESVHVGSGAFTLPVWSDPVVLAPEPEGGNSRNLLLVSLDTLRADHLPSYHYARDTAPFIEERLAARGVVFERAFSAASTTGPSHMTAFTARTPSAHGLRDNILTAKLSPEIPTLAERLRAAGFATGAVTENGALTSGSGIERGFESYREFRTTGPVPHRAETTFAAARDWIDQHLDRPFLLFVQTYETHTPYRAPADTPPLAGPPATLPREHADLRLRKEWQPDAYDHEIRYVDEALRTFIEGLEATGILADTLLVLFSDHGEAFLEHGYLHHGGGIHDEVLHVPLIFVGPGAAVGRRVSSPVGLVDLLPTLLDLLGLPAVPDVMGRSFADLVRGEPADPDWSERPLFSEAWAKRRVELVEGRIRKVTRQPPTLAVRQGTRKLIRDSGPAGHRYHYFDLATDPREQHDLYVSQPESAADLRTLLEDYARAHVRPPDPDASSTDESLDPEREEALRALGYLE